MLLRLTISQVRRLSLALAWGGSLLPSGAPTGCLIARALGTMGFAPQAQGEVLDVNPSAPTMFHIMDPVRASACSSAEWAQNTHGADSPRRSSGTACDPCSHQAVSEVEKTCWWRDWREFAAGPRGQSLALIHALILGEPDWGVAGGEGEGRALPLQPPLPLWPHITGGSGGGSARPWF